MNPNIIPARRVLSKSTSASVPVPAAQKAPCSRSQSVIVGFPGEGEAEFGETYALLERLAPAFLHVFPFSERPGTPAVELPGKVQPSVATRRVAELEALCEPSRHQSS